MKNKKLKVLIGTPTYDGKFDVYYVDSLLNTIALKDQNIEIYPLFICYDSLIQRARNDIFKIAYESDVDILVFIDADVGWNPQDFFKLVRSNKDIIGGSYRKKSDDEELYVVKAMDDKDPSLNLTIDTDDSMEVAGLGCGFMKVSRKAIVDIWNTSKPYKSVKGDSRMIFEVVCEDNDLISEDIYFCKKWRDLGNKVYLDTSITCTHTGTKTFFGNVKNWIAGFKDKGVTSTTSPVIGDVNKFVKPTKYLLDDFKVL